MRVCVCGDEGTGKSSLITSLVKGTSVTGKIQPVLPHVTIPPFVGNPDNVTTTIVDTSAAPPERDRLNNEIRKSNVILLVYSDDYSYERVGLFWMPHFRSLGVNIPVVLCPSKRDLLTQQVSNGLDMKEEMLEQVREESRQLMNEFKEVESGIHTSARKNVNVNEAIYLCQKAVTYPLAPLYDLKETNFKLAASKALGRVFHLLDKDKNGYLSDEEMQAFQRKCFGKDLSETALFKIKEAISKDFPDSVTEKGIDSKGFWLLNKLFVEKGSNETVWITLRAFHYSDSLSLKEDFVSPKFDVPANCSAELSPAGYKFLADLFELFDQDNDGALNTSELADLFAPTEGLPSSWLETSYASNIIMNDNQDVTLQGWLAQWSMTTFKEPKTTLAYLAYFGFEPSDHRLTTTAALKVTKAWKRAKRSSKADRNVVQAYIVGSSECGKSTLVDSFLARPFTNHPNVETRSAVNSVELPGGKQCYLILEELRDLDVAMLGNHAKLDSADLIVYAYDSSDPDSFSYIVNRREKHAQLEPIPSLFVALKADNDKADQRTSLQPDDYATSIGLHKPVHVSAKWPAISDLFVQIADTARNPSKAYVKSEDDSMDRTNLYIAFGAAVCAAAAFVGIWRRLLEK